MSYDRIIDTWLDILIFLNNSQYGDTRRFSYGNHKPSVIMKRLKEFQSRSNWNIKLETCGAEIICTQLTRKQHV